MVMERQLKPVIVFSFSRQNCEALALDMSKLDFNTRQYTPHIYTDLYTLTDSYTYTGVSSPCYI